MHGKTVISLLASESCGVAKKAKIHFFSDDYYDGKNLVQKRGNLLQRIKVWILLMYQLKN